MNDDMYSLVEWLKEQELKAHNDAAKHHGFTKGIVYESEEKTYHKVIDKIVNGRVSQRPHIKGGIV